MSDDGRSRKAFYGPDDMAALTYDRDFAPARTLVTQISWHEYEKAERDRDLDRLAVTESMVREHGGTEYAAKLEAHGTIELSATPADATAYLFEYVEHKNRLVPVPHDGKKASLPRASERRTGESRGPLCASSSRLFMPARCRWRRSGLMMS